MIFLESFRPGTINGSWSGIGLEILDPTWPGPNLIPTRFAGSFEELDLYIEKG